MAPDLGERRVGVHPARQPSMFVEVERFGGVKRSGGEAATRLFFALILVALLPSLQNESSQMWQPRA